MKCCSGCFDDNHLTHQTFAFHPALERGTCDYCEAEDVSLLPPEVLRDVFEPLVGMYPDNPKGEAIVELLKRDWLLFPHLGRANAKELLGHILGNANAAERTCIEPRTPCLSSLEKWRQFRQELMYENRYFPKSSFAGERGERLKELFSYLLLKLAPATKLFRARLQVGEPSLELGAMGAPPRDISKHGRANPAGIPYLYLASDAHTAVSEVRPHPGEKACVASFELLDSVRVVDLRQPRKTVSPFQLGDEEKIVQLQRDLEFLEQVSDELTRPVVPRAAAVEYVPTQYVCELIKSVGFGGVVYRSSVGEGYNLALFQSDLAEARELERHQVRRVLVETDLIGRRCMVEGEGGERWST